MSHYPEDRFHFFFFGGRELTSLYLTSAIITFVDGLVVIFVPIYLWKLGYELWHILAFHALTSLAFVIAAAALLPILRRMSDKAMMLAGMPFLIAYFYGLRLLGPVPLLFFVLPAAYALSSLFINIGYNVDFSASSDDSVLGREVGMRFTMSSLAKFAAPFVGGVLIASFGFGTVFMFSSLLLVLGVVPLFFFTKRSVAEKLYIREVIGFIRDKSLRPFNLSSAGYAVEKSMGLVVWPLFLFLTLGSFEQFGGVISASLLVGIFITYLAGVLSDRGSRRTVLTWSAGLESAVWAVRVVLARPLFIISSQIAGALAYSGVVVSWSAQYYKLARATNIPGVFVVSREMLYNASRAIVVGALALFAYFVSIQTALYTGYLIGAVASLLFLYANKEHTKALDRFVKDGE